MNREILLATNNPGKLREYREILAPLGYTIYCPRDLNIDLDPEESGTTYRENSLIKAKAFREWVSFPVIADDSGFEVIALDDFPGLYSSRFAKECGTYPKAMMALNEKLGDNPNRSARFRCCICLLEKEDSKPLYFEGFCEGYLLPSPKGENGFGYDPIFHGTELDKDFGLISEEEKNQVSHRAKAIQKLAVYLAIR